MTLEQIQDEITKLHDKYGVHVGSLSDTYHSFDDLYEHRLVLSAALFRNIPFTWKARVHEDGTMFDGMFIVGVSTPDGHASYHYDLKDWDRFKVPEIPHAPEFDGHTPEDAIARIEKYFARGILRYNDEEMRKLGEGPLKDLADVFDDETSKQIYFDTFMKRK